MPTSELMREMSCLLSDRGIGSNVHSEHINITVTRAFNLGLDRLFETNSYFFDSPNKFLTCIRPQAHAFKHVSIPDSVFHPSSNNLGLWKEWCAPITWTFMFVGVLTSLRITAARMNDRG
jgi:hypothetical protein